MSGLTDALALIESWPVDHAAAAIVVDGRTVGTHGPTDRLFRLASIAKTMTAWAVLVAVEEGIIELDTVVAPDVNGATVRHVLSHAGGYPFDGSQPMADIERKRIYSNTGIEVAAQAVADAADMSFESYLRLGVFEPLDMTSSQLRGSPAHAIWSSVGDVAAFISEIMKPTLLSAEMAADAVRPHFPTLGGIVPGVGRFDTCPWGMGFEVRGDKSPHWTGSRNSAETFGHFGGAGTVMWIDPAVAPGRSIGVVALTDRPFDDWAGDAMRLWPEFSNAVVGAALEETTTD